MTEGLVVHFEDAGDNEAFREWFDARSRFHDDCRRNTGS